jgi:hypothetical protein
MEMGYRRTVKVQFPIDTGDFSFLHSVQTGSEAHPGVKRPESAADPIHLHDIVLII